MNLMLDDLYPSMPWEKIDSVVFDVGNVLLTFSHQELLKKHVPDHPELYPALMERVFVSPYWPMLDRGVLDSEGAIAPMTGNHPELREAIERIMRGWIDLDHVIDEGVDTLRCCKAHGKKLYVLSNYNDKAFAYAREKHAFFDLFDDFVISAKEGLVKPDPALFRRLTSRFDLVPERTLFIDDSYVNTEGALHCSWQAICYNRPGKLRDFFGNP